MSEFLPIEGLDPEVGFRAVEKADLMSTSGTAADHIMNAEQSKSFLSLGMDRAVMIKDSDIWQMKGPTRDINQITLDGLASVVGAADEVTAVTAAERAVPSFSRETLAVEEFLLQARVSKVWLEDNIAKAGGWKQAQTEFSLGLLWAMENVAWRSDTTAANPTGWGNRLGTQINGWRTQATTYTYDHGGSVPNRALFHEMFLTLPTQYRVGDWKQQYRFYAHPDLIEHFWYLVEARETTAGDGFLLKDNKLQFRGVQFVSAACFQTDIVGTGAASGLGADTTEVLLCEPKNKVVGYHPGIWTYRDRSTDGRIHYITYGVRMDVAFRREQTVVRAFNVHNST